MYYMVFELLKKNTRSVCENTIIPDNTPDFYACLKMQKVHNPYKISSKKSRF